MPARHRLSGGNPGTGPVTSAWIRFFRFGLATALTVITFLALAPVDPPTLDQQDKLHHALAFLSLAFLADYAFPQTGFGMVKYLSLFAYGLGLEWMQTTLVDRVGSLPDLLANAAGLLTYALLIPLLRRVSPFSRRWSPPAPGQKRIGAPDRPSR